MKVISNSQSYLNIAKQAATDMVNNTVFIARGAALGAGIVGLGVGCGAWLIGHGTVRLATVPFLAGSRTVAHTYGKLPGSIKSPIASAAGIVMESGPVKVLLQRACQVKGAYSELVAKVFPLTYQKGHQVARKERPDIYPERQAVLDHQVSWDFSMSGYRPVYFVADVVLENDRTVKKGGWADPEDLSKMPEKVYKSFEGKVKFDEQGMPLNPRGRTGLKGRGLLGKWGANYAADPIVTRVNPDTGHLEVLLIQRVDNGQWALPGGMVDDGEVVTETLRRELEEEAGVKLGFDKAPVVYKGYVDDRRNTDNAWMETTAVHLHLKPNEVHLHARPVAGDDAKKAKWIELDRDLKLYASHNEILKKVFKNYSFGLSQEIKGQVERFQKS